MYRDMWEAAMDEMVAKLVHVTPDGEYTYVAELNRCAPLVGGHVRA